MFDADQLKRQFCEYCDDCWPDDHQWVDCHTAHDFVVDILILLRGMGDRVQPLTRYERDGVSLFIPDNLHAAAVNPPAGSRVGKTD